MRLSRLLRAPARPQFVLGFTFTALLLVAYFLYTFPTSFGASASRYFSQTEPLDPAIARLQQRAFTMGGIRPVCPLRDWHAERYAGLSNSSNIFLAINFYNNEDVLPNFFQELPVMLKHLGPERVYVSIFENGSTDQTQEMLGMLQRVLNIIGSPNTVVFGEPGETSRLPGHRIEILSRVRNKVLEPLYDGSAAEHVPRKRFDELLFMNDISFCAADMLELLYEKRTQHANQVCSVDWMQSVVYDRWVLRDMRGKPFYRWEDVTFYYKWLPNPWTAGFSPPLRDSPKDRARFENHLPLQVFSCWNGATVFDADVFAAPDGIRFRMSHADIGEDGRPAAFSDKASECFLSSVDMWKAGRGKIMVVPKASVSYDAGHYRVHRKDYLMPPTDGRDKVIWEDKPPAQVAMQDYGFWWGPERWAPWDEQR
ncbi:cryptococcal mannosyltransferase 1-domain-containing protein [Vararia minispora EC-137]|uniref:Cryptococcal mannosyltransferase 1-domain-containing protein n=1 Tax=Vararia minispora EC-137 TaxID=1314806 RepID=A0ACB8QA15_9AGAM|nr:cryptococcal mannosyltransferase 1-domain-containing protein [Vararia minispora EC-137]